MNTLATYLPSTTAKADSPKLRVWAFSAAVRLSDQDKPIAFKLLVELAIVLRMLAQLVQNAQCATGKTVVACRAKRPVARDPIRRSKAAKRTAIVKVRQHAVHSGASSTSPMRGRYAVRMALVSASKVPFRAKSQSSSVSVRK